ncbi:MAG: helix-hairpin-helix domain-containing protein [Caldimonas sp.]
MFKKFVAALAMLFAATMAFAAVDANKASQAELEAIKGIGPVISSLIISERKKGDFKDWTDLVTRVKGVGDRSAAKFSEGGLTVGGQAYAGAPATAAPAKSTGAKAAEKTKEVAAKTGAVVKTGAEKAASGVKGAATVVKENAKDEKNALKDNVADAKAKRAEKKAEKAEKKAEKAEKAASAPKK